MRSQQTQSILVTNCVLQATEQPLPTVRLSTITDRCCKHAWFADLTDRLLPDAAMLCINRPGILLHPKQRNYKQIRQNYFHIKFSIRPKPPNLYLWVSHAVLNPRSDTPCYMPTKEVNCFVSINSSNLHCAASSTVICLTGSLFFQTN